MARDEDANLGMYARRSADGVGRDVGRMVPVRPDKNRPRENGGPKDHGAETVRRCNCGARLNRYNAGPECGPCSITRRRVGGPEPPQRKD